ncbi:hypothetical protein BSFA1_82310 (plasmid) [Burkholderia sp. SFA1]|nr:hypothetical protein BSFA1_82310 [Burkholderia sp. SFA1]
MINLNAKAQPGPVVGHGIDEGGSYKIILKGWSPNPNEPWTEKVYYKPAAKPDGSLSKGGQAVRITPPDPRPPVSDQESQANYEAAKAKFKDDNPNGIVDEKASASSYTFGQAGAQTVVAGFAYGVAASLAGLPDQASRLSALQAEVDDLQAAVRKQIADQAAAEQAAAIELAKRGQRANQLLGSKLADPSLVTMDLALSVGARDNLFATPDPIFASQLQQANLALSSDEAANKPPVCVEFGKALVRQADAESALGNDATASGAYGLARTVADVVIGIDPVSGVIRSTYELTTGRNLITGEELSDMERSFAAINLILLGGFGEAQKGLQVLGRVAHVIGGAKGKAMFEAVVNVGKNWPTKMIDKVLQWRAARVAEVGGEAIVFASSREIVPVGAVDGWYARVMDREHAHALLEGGKLSADPLGWAFVTESTAIAGIDSRAELARRLYILDKETLNFVSLENHVVVEFRFASDYPLWNIAKPFGEVGTHGVGWVPGGYTAGGAVEWVVDSDAIQKGIVDAATIKIREIPRP